MKVKTFEALSLYHLEEAINNYLSFGRDLVDIKFSCFASGESAADLYCAMLIYKENK